jgi:N-ethylmaleimide reductase
MLDSDPAALVAYVADPDLVERVRRGAALNRLDYATLHTPGPRVYTDYPVLDD